MHSPANLAAALTAAAELMHAPATREDTVAAILDATLQTVPGFDHAGISITHKDDSIETIHGTDQLVWELDKLQYGLNEGPCYDAIREGHVVVVPHARHAQSWPRYIPQAAQLGLRAQLAIPLFRDEESVGGLNLYSTSSETVSDDAFLIAELFASHASIALGRSQHEGQLREAIETRKVIGQAIGLVMERYQLDEHRAFKFLVRTSQAGNIKLRVVAEEIVNSANARYGAQTLEEGEERRQRTSAAASD
jgi:GAF domain-containing protein